jgi:uncharacterized protein (UPF0335 family)
MSDTKEKTRVEPEIFLARYRQVHDKRQELKEKAGEVNAEYDLAAAAGINVVALKAVTKLMKMDPRDAQHAMRDMILYLKWLGQDVLEYRDLLDNSAGEGLTAAVMATHRIWEAEKLGYADGKRGDPLDANPKTPGSDEHPAYVRGWRDGAADRDSKKDISPPTSDEPKPRGE